MPPSRMCLLSVDITGLVRGAQLGQGEKHHKGTKRYIRRQRKTELKGSGVNEKGRFFCGVSELQEKYSSLVRARHCKSFDMVWKLGTLSCIHPITKSYPCKHKQSTWPFGSKGAERLRLLLETGALSIFEKSGHLWLMRLIKASHLLTWLWLSTRESQAGPKMGSDAWGALLPRPKHHL